jgi:thiol:disulfide interchange protein
MKPKRRIRRHKESNREKSPFFSGQVLAHDQGPTFFQSSAAQAKLKVGKVNDPYEKQADATAHAIVNNSGTGKSGISPAGVQRKEESAQAMKIRKQEEEEVQAKMQRQAEAEEEEVQMKLQKQEEEEAQAKLQKQEGAEEEEVQAKLQKQEEEEVQTKLQKQEEEEAQTKSEVFRKEDTAAPSMTTESRISQAKSGGQALPDDVRMEVENQLGASFKKVRIHDDSESHDLCEELNALAFASGHHIFFKKGAYQPYSQDGKFLLIHELTHVIQQRNNTF